MKAPLQIHKASAGSGKTFTLAREYIRLLLGHHDPETGEEHLRTKADYGPGKEKAHASILAVTFTNKATEEMTQRIVRELYLLAHLNDRDAPRSDHADYFCGIFHCSDATLAEASRRALADLLFNFSMFNVSTIDSFFSNIVRSFARDLDLPDNYTLEIDQQYPVTVSANKALGLIDMPDNSAQMQDSDTRKRRNFLAMNLHRYMLQLMSDGKVAQILSQSSSANHAMVDTIYRLINEEYKLHSGKIDAYLADVDTVQKFQQALTARVDDYWTRLAAAARALLAQNPKGLFHSPTLTYLDKVAAGQRIAPTDSVARVSDEFVSGETALDDLLTKAGKASASAPLRHDAATALTIIGGERQRVALYDFLRKHLYVLVIFGYVTRQLDQYCRDNDMFLLGNTNQLIQQLIDEQDAPFIYERTTGRITNYLIDEFQDTSKMQWSNFWPLMHDSLSTGESNLIIGDEKQCIYRFRNADPDLLGSKVEKQVTDETRCAPDVHGIDISENKNYRSSREVVLFNNTVFRAMAQAIDSLSPSTGAVSHAYAGLVQKVDKTDLPGYVKLLMHARRSAEETSEDSPTLTPTDILTLGELTAEIGRQLAAGYRARDIAVLVRDHASGQKVIDYLMQHMGEGAPLPKLEIMSQDALEIGANRSVRAIVNMLRMLITPEEVTVPGRSGEPQTIENPAIARQRLIHRYAVALSKGAEPKTALAQAVAALSADEPDELQQQIEADMAALASQPCPNLYELVEEISSRVVLADRAEADNAFVTAFLDQVLTFSEQGRGDLRSFLQWWDRKGASESLTSPEGLDAITVTTIHQSKGLEYNCVHVPFFSRALLKRINTGTSWYHLDPAELPDIDPELVPQWIPLPNDPGLTGYAPFAAQYAHWCEQQRLDALNVAYVAFTRAKRELTVYSTVTPSGGDTTGSMLRAAVETATPEWVGAQTLPDREPEDDARTWLAPLSPGFTLSEIAPAEAPDPTEQADGGNKKEQKPEWDAVLTFGEPTSPLQKEDKKGEWGEIPARDLGRYLKRYHTRPRKEIAVAEDRDELSGLDLEGADLSDIPALSGRIRREIGTFMHRVLASVRRKSDLPHAMRRAAYRARLTSEQTASLQAYLERALDKPEVSRWFEGYGSVATERSETGDRGVVRADRIVRLTGGETHIVDYKFGADEKSRYDKQVQGYMRWLLRGGEERVRGFLWFPLTGEIREVTLPPETK